MGVNFDKWTVLKLLEVASTVACLIFKKVTDDEASRLFLYLQKLSREWSLLNNVTWDRVGAAAADATYGGYVIITAALFIGRLAGELPTQRRITEFVLLGVGTILFIILGSLEFAALDSVPEDLVDNAAIIGTLTLVTAALFLLDMGGPRARKNSQQSQTPPRSKPAEAAKAQQAYEIEKDTEKEKEVVEKPIKQSTNGHVMSSPNGVNLSTDANGRYRDSMYKKIKDDKQKSFDIYGKDLHDGSENDEVEDIPPKLEEHSPVWSKIRKGQYGKYDILSPSYLYPKDKEHEDRPPSSPGDPGYVQYTAQHWGETVQKTPRQSPTQV